jgi:hypothetical protein
MTVIDDASIGEPFRRPWGKKRRKEAVTVYVDRFLWKWSLDHPDGAGFRDLLLSPLIEPLMDASFPSRAAIEAPELGPWVAQLRANATLLDARFRRTHGGGVEMSRRVWFPTHSPGFKMFERLGSVPDLIQDGESRVFLAVLCGAKAFVTSRDYFLKHRGEPIVAELGFDFWPPDEFVAAWSRGSFSKPKEARAGAPRRRRTMQ